MKVFVTGGTGYVGQAVVKALYERGYQVTVLQRPQTPRPISLPVDTVTGDLFSEAVLSSAIGQCDAVVHLVGIIRERPRHGITMETIHVNGTQRVVEAAKAAGVKRFLHMSALGARRGATSRYHQSKWKAEEIVRDSSLDYTIFQPSVVYGKGGPGPEFIGQLRDLVQSGPVTPMIGKGDYVLQPVPLSVLSAAFVNALERPQTIGKTYEIGGADVVTYADILKLLAVNSGKPLRSISIPESLMRMLVMMFGRFPWFPITADQFTMLIEGNVCRQDSTANEDLGLPKAPFQL